MKSIFAPVVLLLLGTGLASATIITYTAVDVGAATNVGTNTSTEFNTFTGVLTGFSAADVDTLQSVALGTLTGSLGTADGVTITASCSNCDTGVEPSPGTNTVSGIVNDGDIQNGYSTSNGIPQTSGAATGTQFYRVAGAEVVGVSQNSALTLSFSGLGVKAFGVELTDIQLALGTTTVTFNDGSPESFVLSDSETNGTGCPGGCPSGGDQFFGFTTSGLVTSITFTTVQTHIGNISSRDVYGLDELVIGNQSTTPEPATFGLIGTALAGLAAYGYRRRRRV